MLPIRVSVAPAGAVEPQSRSVVSPPAATTAACMLLLATMGGGGDPVGSLLLEQESQFRVHAASLRLPTSDAAERDEIASQLLWHGAREMAPLRSGSALLAQPASEDDDSMLQSLGFSATSMEQQPLLALLTRRDPSEVASYSHTTLRVSDIVRSLDFWSLFHFTPSRTFSTNGARAAWLSAPWTSLSIELIEVPQVVLQQMPSYLLKPSSESLGPAHVALDVTALGLSLPSTLALLQQRSDSTFGKTLRVIMEPHQQMMGNLVAEVAILRAPDGVQLRLTHMSGMLSQEIEPDWTRDQPRDSGCRLCDEEAQRKSSA